MAAGNRSGIAAVRLREGRPGAKQSDGSNGVREIGTRKETRTIRIGIEKQLSAY